MAILGYASGGASGLGPSKMFDRLPFKGWREVNTWVEEFVDALGFRFDVLNSRFISAAARARLLDPTVTPTDVATQYLATSTAPPIGAASRDTMLDVLLFVALGISGIDSNLSVAQRQALVQVGWSALRRKATRLQLLNLASQLSDGVVQGWTVPPNNFSLILPDGAPSPGWGSWVQASSSVAETVRPWILSALRSVLAPGTPAFSNLGVGYSQFRAGYSSAGETVFPSGARINVLTHEHFDTWGAGVPTGWTKTGTGGTLTQSTTDTSINWEFTGNAAVLDLSSAAAGVSLGLSQTTANINNQYTHRFQLDYKYTNTQNASVLTVQINEVNSDGKTYYYNNATQTWSTTAYTIVAPVSSTRGRLAFDIVPQAANSTSTNGGTSSITVAVGVTSDGTATTKTTYTLYRVGLYEKFSLPIETAALGERSAWHPLTDAPGWTAASRSDSVTLVVPNKANRSQYRKVTTGNVGFAYHPALSGYGLLATSAWTNQLKGSNDFITDWVVSSASRTANGTISPLLGETSASATVITSTAANAFVSQQIGVSASSKTFCAGVWVKKISSDAAIPTISLIMSASGGTTNTITFSPTQAQGWTLLTGTFPFVVGDIAAPSFQVQFGTGSGQQIALASAYVYDVTGKTGVLYPPVIQTAVGSTGTLGATTCKAVTSTTDSNVLHPLTQRTLQSVVRGALGITIVPTFDASSQPNGVIFDLAQGAAQNRVCLRVNSGALELHRWDNSGNQWTASLTLTGNASPASGSMTWLRDTAITIRALWDANQTTLSAGNGNASGSKPGSWAPSDTSVAFMRYGCDYAASNQFDGSVSRVEHGQLGAPVS